MYLVDTNILLRFLFSNDPAYSVIRRAVGILKTRRERCVTTPQNFAEFWNVCTRPPTARGGLALTVEATERRLRLLERHFHLLPDNPEIYNQWKLLVTTHNVMGVQVHDARLVASMIVNGVTHILTANVAHSYRKRRGLHTLSRYHCQRA
jgi:predicted nucleic acid-binding protein